VSDRRAFTDLMLPAPPRPAPPRPAPPRPAPPRPAPPRPHLPARPPARPPAHRREKLQAELNMVKTEMVRATSRSQLSARAKTVRTARAPQPEWACTSLQMQDGGVPEDASRANACFTAEYNKGGNHHIVWPTFKKSNAANHVKK
jgi:hypothetical protein